MAGIVRIAVLGLVWLASAACLADSVVVASNSTDWPPGRVVSDGEAVNLAAGERLSLLTGSGQKLDLAGERSGPVEQVAGSGGSRSVTLALASLLKGPAQDSSFLGATRSAVAPPSTEQESAPRDPRAVIVDVTRSHEYCVAPWQKVLVSRPEKILEPVLIVTDLATDRSEKVRWGADSDLLEWPASMPVADGLAVNVTLGPLMGPVRLEFRPVPIESQELGEIAVGLIEARCEDQARDLLGQMQREEKRKLQAASE